MFWTNPLDNRNQRRRLELTKKKKNLFNWMGFRCHKNRYVSFVHYVIMISRKILWSLQFTSFPIIFQVLFLFLWFIFFWMFWKIPMDWNQHDNKFTKGSKVNGNAINDLCFNLFSFHQLTFVLNIIIIVSSGHQSPLIASICFALLIRLLKKQ